MTPEDEIHDPNVHGARLRRYGSSGSAVVGGVLVTAGLILYLLGARAGDWYLVITSLGLLIGLGRNAALRRI
jgi:hypothetical protein